MSDRPVNVAPMTSTRPAAGGRASGRTASGGFRCSGCGAEFVRWAGRCPRCQEWGTLEAQAPAPRRAAGLGGAGRAVAATEVTAPAQPVVSVDVTAARRRPTGIDELDRVLGGGLVPGAVILLAGEPGVGKSTLLLEVAARSAAGGARALVVTGEESAAQVRLRAGRTGALHEDLWIAAETDLGAVLRHVEEVSPALLVVDSVQTISAAGVEGAAGGVTQVREVTAALIRTAKALGLATVLVGHVTKDGLVAGPRLLEHLVDVVLHFEGERHSALRLVRAGKNRYGPADEVGCFEMDDAGIHGIADPSGLFLSRSGAGGLEAVPGTCVTVTVEGRRPLVAEVQALVAETSAQVPRRAVSGLDPARVAMILAVVERRAKVRFGKADVYAATVGGVRLAEPAADLATALAVVSAARDRPLPADLVAVGEVGLAGEVRAVGAVRQRLAAAARLGFRRALVPAGAGPGPEGMKVTEVPDLIGAITRMHEA
ncbi:MULTISPECIES: DNA repair protein RadA [Frankia]|uniref:DNA repair protein RadA n=2 Tax=Frankia TaxID=1854 RepID=Q0RBN3_FRAAA|nr:MULTISPECIES: DNA repair protein RadA [Frankia]CAJ65151.1 putative ATP-dependent protease, with nucleoside triP hydrolase and multiheme cytochrome domains, DNA repair protein [Frankia alni ACN14a]